MKKLSPFILILLTVSLFSSCEVIGDIFKAGVWVGIVMVVVVVGLIIWLFSKLMGGGK